MKKQPSNGLLFLWLMVLVLAAFVLRHFLAPHWILLILAPPLGVWLYFDDKRWRCPRCHKHFGRIIRHLDHCPNCGLKLNDE